MQSYSIILNNATLSIITASTNVHKIPTKETFQRFKPFPPIARNVQLCLQ